jgi:hypothetical protein
MHGSALKKGLGAITDRIQPLSQQEEHLIAAKDIQSQEYEN